MTATIGQAPVGGDAFQRMLMSLDYSFTQVATVPGGGAGPAQTVRAYIDYVGRTAGTSQALRGILYDGTSGALLASSAERIIVADGSADSGVGVATDFTLTSPPNVSDGQVLRFGLIGGPPHQTLALSRCITGSPVAGTYSPDTYSDGPANPYGTPTTDTGYGIQLLIGAPAAGGTLVTRAGIPMIGSSLALSTAAGAVVSGGFLRTAGKGLAATTTQTGMTWVGGFRRAPKTTGKGMGALVYDLAGAVAYRQAGIPRTSNGAIAATTGTTGLVRIGGGLWRDSAGRLAINVGTT
jgi:hypothetical protein